MSRRDVQVLKMVKRNEGRVEVEDVALKLDCSPELAQSVVDRLEALDLVERRPQAEGDDGGPFRWLS